MRSLGLPVVTAAGGISGSMDGEKLVSTKLACMRWSISSTPQLSGGRRRFGIALEERAPQIAVVRGPPEPLLPGREERFWRLAGLSRHS